MIILEKGKKAQKIDKVAIEKEAQLQEYIQDNPGTIPVYEIEEDKKLLVVARELQTQSGPIDALAIDKDGEIYVVETKIEKNPDKRQVVAQALDYGASLWRHSNFDEIIAKINNKVNEKFKVNFDERVKSFFQIDDEQMVMLVESLRRNFQDGKIKFVILMDTVEDRLKDLIVYINQNSQFDIYAVQMEYYTFDKYEIVIPKLFGVEVKKSVSSSGGSRAIKNWTENEFLLDAKNRLTEEQYKAVEKLFNFSKQNSNDIILGTGQGKGSINPIFSEISERKIYEITTVGKLVFHIEWAISGAVNEQAINKLKIMSENLEKIGLVVKKGDEQRMKIEKWADKIDQIIEILEEIIK